MRKMIREYEQARKQVRSRIRELNKILKEGRLMNGERDKLKSRKELLQDESIEMLHVIIDLKQHCE